MTLLEEVKTYETLWGEQEALVEKLYREMYMNDKLYLNPKEEACVELIRRQAFAVAHEEMQKLTELERANIENNCSFEEFDGYLMWTKGLIEAEPADFIDEIGNYDGTSDK